MDERTKILGGLDVHKDSISVAAAEPGRAPGRLIGKVAHDVNKLLKVLAKIGTAEQLHLVYEAGPTGFGLQGALKARGYVCAIIAPSQTPRRPGEGHRHAGAAREAHDPLNERTTWIDLAMRREHRQGNPRHSYKGTPRLIHDSGARQARDESQTRW